MRDGHVKDWLEPMCRVWRGQTLAKWDGTDGWPTTTVIGRIRTERDGASQGTPTQRTYECYTGDGLLIRRALEGLSLPPREVFYAHWLSRDPVRTKADELGISVARYWTLLDSAYYWIAGRVQVLDNETRAEAI